VGGLYVKEEEGIKQVMGTREKDKRIHVKRVKSAAFTLIEIVIVMFLVTVLFLVLSLLVAKGQSHYHTGSALASLQAQSRRAVDEVAREVRETGEDVLFDAKGFPLVDGVTYHTVILRRNAGYLGGIVWGEMIAYTFRYAQNELADGVDNDNDGLVDEGEIVRMEVSQDRAEAILVAWEAQSGGLSDDSGDDDDKDDLTEADLLLSLLAAEMPLVVICENLEKQGLSFVRHGQQNEVKVLISVAVEDIDENRRRLKVSADTMVTPRNLAESSILGG